MDSQLTNQKKSLRRSVRVITPDQIKKLGLDVTLRNLITRQTGIQNGEVNLEKAANNTITKAKLKISIHKSNDLDETVSQQIHKSPKPMDSTQKSSRRISTKNSVNITKFTRNRASLKGSNESVSDNNCKGENSANRKLRSNTKADNIVKPQNVDLNKTVSITDKINLKETRECNLIAHEDISMQPANTIDNFVKDGHLENINPSEVAGKKKLESFQKCDINIKVNEDTHSGSLKKATTDGVSRCEENNIKISSVARKKRISSEAVNKIKLSRNNDRKKEEFENVAKKKALDKDEISSVDEEDQSLIETPSNVSKECTNKNNDLPGVSRQKRISGEALNKMSLRRNNRKKEILDLENVDEKAMKIDDSIEQEVIETLGKLTSSTTAVIDKAKSAAVENGTILLENAEENIGILKNINKRISSEALNKINLRRNNDVLNKSLEVECADENIMGVNQKEIDESPCKDQPLIEPLNKSASLSNVDISNKIDVVENGLNASTSKINLASASKKKKISTEALNKMNSRRNNKKKGIIEMENIEKGNAMEIDQSPCVEQQDRSLIETPSKFDAVENDANENNVNFPCVSRKKKISSVALSKINLNRYNKQKEIVEIENVERIGIETLMDVDSPCIEIEDQPLIENPSELIVEISTEIDVIKKNVKDKTSNINSPSVDRKKNLLNVALNKVNLNSKNKKIFELEDVENVGTESLMETDEISCVEQKDESFIEKKSIITNDEMKLTRNNNRRTEAIDTVSNEDAVKLNIENIEEVESSDDDNRLVIDEHTSNDKLNETLIVEANAASMNLNISSEISTHPKKKETNIALNESSNQNNSNDFEIRRTSRKITRHVNTSNVARRSSKRKSINNTKHELPEIKRKSENKEDNLFMQLEDDKVLQEENNLNNKGSEQPHDLLAEDGKRKNTRTSTIEVNLEETNKTEVRCSKRTSLRRKQGDKSTNAGIDCNLQQVPAALRVDDTFSDKSNYKGSQVLKSENEELAKLEIKETLKKVSERTDKNVKVRNTNNKLKESLTKSDTMESDVNVSVNEINKCDEKRISRTPKITASRKNAIEKGSNDNENKPVQKKITDFLFFNEKPVSEKNLVKSRKRKASSDIIERETGDLNHATKDTSADDTTELESQKVNKKVLKIKRAKPVPELLKEHESDNKIINVAESVTVTANVKNDEDELKPKNNKRKRSNITELDNTSKKFKEDSLENLKNDEGESIIEMYNTSNQQKKLIELYSVELKQMYAELLKKPGRKFGKISGTVVCALCDQSLKSTLWMSHKLKHNNIAWRVGEEPMSLEPSVITTVLNAMYKGRKKICCHKCTDSKKSVFGFLCHFVVCGKNKYELEEMKVPCEVCGTKILPCLYLFHFKIHLKAEKTVSSIVTKPKDISSESPRKARVAAKKANVMIESVSKYLDGTDDGYFVKNIFKKSDLDVVLNKEISSKGFVCCPFEGCEAKLENVDKILKHFEECSHKPEEVYMCKKCFHCNKVRADMINHVQQHQKQKKRKNDDGEFNANASDSSEETDHEDNKSVTTPSKSKNSQSISKFCKLAFLGEKYKKTYLHGVLCNRNYMWMLQFCQDNFNDKKLFMNYAFSSKYVNAMDPEDISNYLPKMKRSINMQQNIKDFGANKSKSNQNCKQYKLFETESNKTSTNIYCGGPISATTWAPTPYDADTYNQVLAVALNLDVNKSYTFSEINTDKGLLQFWSFGNMNSQTLREVLEPELAFCIGHSYGYVTSMEWCPSGCYDEDRLGLLCICCSDSFVYGLPVSQPNRVTSKMLNAKPAFKLSLNKWRDMDLGDCVYHPTTISWSKCAGHKYIAIGYSNGVVALFDLSTDSELLRKQDDDLQVYFPYKTFLAHADIVTSIQLFHLNGGNRWLVTGSNDRMVKFWDLQQTAIPIYINQRTYVSQLLWPINYIGTVDAHNDFLNSVLQTTTISHIRDFASSINNVLMYTGTSVNSISCNEWSSIIVQGNEMGEVIGCHFNNFFSSSAPKKFYISNIGLEGKLASNNIDTTVYPTYKDVCDNFNVVSNDYDMQFYFNVIKKSDALVGHRGLHSSPKPNIFPIQAVTQVSVNPNRYSYYYIAAGYKLGFVKIFKMKMFQSN